RLLTATLDTRDLHSFPTRRSSDLGSDPRPREGDRARSRTERLAARGSGRPARRPRRARTRDGSLRRAARDGARLGIDRREAQARSEEHTSELQSLAYLVCRLLLEK